MLSHDQMNSRIDTCRYRQLQEAPTWRSTSVDGERKDPGEKEKLKGYKKATASSGKE